MSGTPPPPFPVPQHQDVARRLDEMQDYLARLDTWLQSRAQTADNAHADYRVLATRVDGIEAFVAGMKKNMKMLVTVGVAVATIIGNWIAQALGLKQ